jgi:hypothetical protein
MIDPLAEVLTLGSTGLGFRGSTYRLAIVWSFLTSTEESTFLALLQGILIDTEDDEDSLTVKGFSFFTAEAFVLFFFETHAGTMVMGVALVINAEEPILVVVRVTLDFDGVLELEQFDLCLEMIQLC